MISDEEIISGFGKRLRAARMIRKMTQEEIGLAIGADKSRISDYEKGRRRCSITTAYRLARALNVSCSFLMDDKSFSRNHGDTEEEQLTLILDCIGHAIVDWNFTAYRDDNFADYSTMFCVGVMDNSFGEALRQFNDLKNSGPISKKDERMAVNISDISSRCAKDLIQHGFAKSSSKAKQIDEDK